MSSELSYLLQQLDDQDAVARGRAAEALGVLDGPGVRDALGRLLDDTDGMVRFKAALALAFRGDDRGLPALLWAMRRTDLCFVALDGLAELGSPEALPEVRRFFRRRFLHPLERMQAAAVLHCCGDEEGTKFLQSRLDSRRPEERGFAIELWGRLRMPDALGFLLGILSDPENGHRLDAVRGLSHLEDPRSLQLLDRVAKQLEDPILAEAAREAAVVVRAAEDPFLDANDR